MLKVLFDSVSSLVFSQAVWAHEHALREQARRMNVDSLRSNVNTSAESAEVSTISSHAALTPFTNPFKYPRAQVRIAKVAVTNVMLWAVIWTPYAFVVFLSVIGSKSSITPLVSQIPSFMAKTASCLNPIVYAMSHPKCDNTLS